MEGEATVPKIQALKNSASMTSLKSSGSATSVQATAAAFFAWDVLPAEWDILLLSTALKLLLYPS